MIRGLRAVNIVFLLVSLRSLFLSIWRWYVLRRSLTKYGCLFPYLGVCA